MTTDELERQVRDILHETLDGEAGPHPVWAESPAARRIIELDRRRRRPPLGLLAVAALIAVAGGSALLAGARNDLSEASGVVNGWIAFTVAQSDPAGEVDDTDIWLVALDQDARRVIGTDTDDVDQLCPAFSPDGRSLAYGRDEGAGTAHVVADVSRDGHISDRLSVDIGDFLPPPCPVWSPDGSRLAFGVNSTSPVNPETSAAGSEVWVVTLADHSITALPDLLATDLEWSPDGGLLAIASGVDERIYGETLQDGRIYLYSHASAATRPLDDTLGAVELTWSPDGRRIAYTTGDHDHDLRVIDVETGQQDVLAAGFGAIHGIGPVWSPDGRAIVYQRTCPSDSSDPSPPCGGEGHEVVIVRPRNPSESGSTPREVVIRAFHRTPDGTDRHLFPYWVTWSPGGEYLLYMAWSEAQPGVLHQPEVLAAVPTDPDMPAIILAQRDGMVAYDGYNDDTTFVPIQRWGRRPSD